MSIATRVIPTWEEFLTLFDQEQYLDNVLGMLHISDMIRVIDPEPGLNETDEERSVRLNFAMTVKVQFYLSKSQVYYLAFKKAQRINRNKSSEPRIHDELILLGKIWQKALQLSLKYSGYYVTYRGREIVSSQILSWLNGSHLYWDTNAFDEDLRKPIRVFLETEWTRDHHEKEEFPVHDLFKTTVFSGNSDLLPQDDYVKESVETIAECLGEFRRFSHERSPCSIDIRIMIKQKGWQQKAFIRYLELSSNDNFEMELCSFLKIPYGPVMYCSGHPANHLSCYESGGTCNYHICTGCKHGERDLNECQCRFNNSQC